MHMLTKKTGMSILISDKIHFMSKTITTKKLLYHDKGSIHWEDVKIINRNLCI